MHRGVADAVGAGRDPPGAAPVDDDRLSGIESLLLPVERHDGPSVENGDEDVAVGVHVLRRSASGLPGEQRGVQVLRLRSPQGPRASKGAGTLRLCVAGLDRERLEGLIGHEALDQGKEHALLVADSVQLYNDIVL